RRAPTSSDLNKSPVAFVRRPSDTQQVRRASILGQRVPAYWHGLSLPNSSRCAGMISSCQRVTEFHMRQSKGVLRVIGEMVAIVVLALTSRFVGFAQTTLESGVPLTVERAFSYFMDLLSVFMRIGNMGLLVSVLGAASLIRISITYANRSVLFGLREIAGIDQKDLTWGQRALRLPFAIVYRSLNGVATLIGAVALAICFR